MNSSPAKFNLRFRATAFAWHLVISATVATAAAALVFGLWYPWPYRVISGGQGLFLLLISVDVVLGPLLTFVVFDRKKGLRHLTRDLTVIAGLQLTGLIYGLHTVCAARPAALVFEVDRFRVVTASDVYAPELSRARAEYQRLPLTGPWLLGTRGAHEGDERKDAVFLALSGVDIAQRPPFWQPYAESRGAALGRSRPVEALRAHYLSRQAELDSILSKLPVSTRDARFVPLMAREQWVVILNSAGDVVGYAPFDGFF